MKIYEREKERRNDEDGERREKKKENFSEKCVWEMSRWCRCVRVSEEGKRIQRK